MPLNLQMGAPQRVVLVDCDAGRLDALRAQPGLTRTGISRTRHRSDAAKEQAHCDQFRIAMEPDDEARRVVFALDQPPPHAQIAEIMALPVNRF